MYKYEETLMSPLVDTSAGTPNDICQLQIQLQEDELRLTMPNVQRTWSFQYSVFRKEERE